MSDIIKQLKKNRKERKKSNPTDELVHINNKEFLCKDGVFSTSAIHSKLYQEGLNCRPKAQLRISDCNNAMRLWNYVDNSEGREDFIEKIDTLIEHLIDYRVQLGKDFDNIHNDDRFILNEK